MASSRRLRQGSRTSDSKATLSSYGERERTSSISACARCSRGGMPSAECCDLQHNCLANWTGSRDANDFCLKNTVSSTGSNGLEVKVAKFPYNSSLSHSHLTLPSFLLTLPSFLPSHHSFLPSFSPFLPFF